MAGPATATAAKEQSYVYRISRDGKQLPTNFIQAIVTSELSLNDNEVHVNRIDKNGGVSDQQSQLAARRDTYISKSKQIP